MFRNKEIGRLLCSYIVITVVFAAIGFVIHWTAGVLLVLSAAALGMVFFVFTKTRYEKLDQLSMQIDKVLHNEDSLYISEMEEGELAILESEIKKMTLRIREQNDALKKEKQHLADSLADIAHQLRTPLTAANLTLSLLQQNPEERERKALLRETEELFVQMDWLLTSLLKLSRLDAGIVVFQQEQLDVDSLIQAALRPLLIAMELHHVTVQTTVPQHSMVWGDKGWLAEALQNILKNCLENLHDGGKIEIICTDTLLFTELTIHDNGPGLIEADLPYLFDRFYRGKNSNAAGYGIGLALCKTIITGHGGTINAKNHRQGGAVFMLRFPK